MIPIAAMDIQWYQYLFLGLTGIGVFLLTYFIYPKIIQIMEKKNYIGHDIHKKDHPPVAESGGLGFSITIVVGFVIAAIIFPQLLNEIIVFITTIAIAAVVGWIDDRKQLSSLKKIILMFIAGLPVFIANLPFIGFISIDSPVFPILGRLQLNVIYPLAVPFIIMIMTNTVNMLEGYNGEGSGSTSIATFFMIIASVLLGSSQGLIYGVVVLSGIAGFYIYNRFPAKIFPGDIGTLVIGASIALVGIFGSIEVVLILVMLPQIFNSFYVIASVRGFKESHTIKKVDIWIDDGELIHATEDHGSPITLPRLLVASGPLSEKQLVRHIMGLSIISGMFSLITALLMAPFFSSSNILKVIAVISLSFMVIVLIIIIYPKIVGITLIMVMLLAIAFTFLVITDQFIVNRPANWLFGSLIGVVILIFWYMITLAYFWYALKRKN